MDQLTDTELAFAYSHAKAFLFPSFAEGFGLPIIEAQAMRKAVITSDLSPLREVSGGAAYLADPFDFLSIREGILKIIKDQNYRQNLITDGIKNISRFKARAIAEKYAALYAEILSANK